MDEMAPSTARTRVQASPDGPAFTLLEIDGERGGPTLVILGGVHGDELQGVRAAARLAERLSGLPLRGTVRIVPVSHEAAFWAASRTSPLDGRNLAREFPGAVDGSPTQRLATLLDSEVIDTADMLIDLHSAGIHYAMPLLVGYCDDGSDASGAAASLAAAAGVPVIWRHPGPPAAGRTGTAPHLCGVPFLYLESTDDVDDTSAYVDAVLRMMEGSGMLPEAALASTTFAERPWRLFGSGDLDSGGVVAPMSGLVEMHVERLDSVRAGQALATMTDPLDGSVASLVAPADAVVVMVRRTGWAARDDLVVFLTQPDATTVPGLRATR